MEKIALKSLLTILLTALMVFSASCSKEGLDKDGASLPSTGTGPGSVPTGQVEGSGFWVNVSSDEHPVLVSTSTSFSDNCIVDAKSTTNEFLTCFIDLIEGDLYVYDINLQYNAPPGLCEHVTVTPAWHWNQSYGRGPRQIEVDVDASSASPTVTACQAYSDQAAGMVACAAHPELRDVLNPQGPGCVYNKADVDQSNCCFGDYTLTINTDDGTDITTTATELTWGGDVRSCIGGAVRTSWGHFASNGIPGSSITAVPEGEDGGANQGLNAEVQLRSNSSSSDSYFSTMANFYTTTGSPHVHTGYFATTSVNVPYMVNPVDDLDGSTLSTNNSTVPGSDAWVFGCYDAGLELKHSLRVYIREWNTAADFLAYEASDGATYNPDVDGGEGTNCDYVGTGLGCNDFSDMDDLLPGAGYDVSTPNAVVRETYFPRVTY